MTAPAVARLSSAVREEPVACDGLHAEYDDNYQFSIPDADIEESGLSEDEFETLAADHEPYVTNWAYWNEDRADADDAFLRWLEAADETTVPERYESLRAGMSRSWGELRIEVRLDDGARRYEIRHSDDVGEDGLEPHDEPLDARSLVTHDDDGRYRPLKTAPSLPHGWVFADQTGRECVETVEYIYPATVANWYLERQGELDIDHWEPTIGRQSGIYGVVQTWNRGDSHEHVNWVAEACCDDSQCVKRREWQYDEETDLDVPGGDGEFPCREPCSLVIAAARKWTRLEGEQEQAYEFTLTPSEKEQVEEIIDAVADGRADEIREADTSDPANRYRARYLRAKRFDEDGNLSGTATESSE